MDILDSYVGIICTSSSWGGLEYNQVKRAIRWRDKRVKILFICCKGTPAHKQALAAHLPIHIIEKPKKSFAYKDGRRLGEILHKRGVDYLITRDRRELSMMAFAKYWWTGKTVCITAMQLTHSQKDPFHSFRFKKVDYWIALLPYLQEQLLRYTSISKDKIHVINEGVEDRFIYELDKRDAKIELGLDPNTKYIGLIGRIDPGKGQLETIQAFKESRLAEKGVELLFMGEVTKEHDNDYYNTLLEVRSQFKLPVHFLPFKENPKAFYKAVDVQVVASHGETYGMVTVEGLVNGATIVGANTNGTEELLSTFGGYLFEAQNPYDLGKQLVLAMNRDNIITNDLSPLKADYSDERYFQLL